MVTAGRNGVPVYKKIQNSILRRIQGGQLQPGDAVHSERELARMHHVSLMTARHALAELEREGMVERRHGSGTFVAQPKIHFNKLTSYTELMAARGLPAHSKVLSLEVVENEQELAAQLSVPITGRLLKIQRQRLGGGEPFALETCYLSADEFRGLTRNRLERGSLFAILEREYGVELAYADEEIDATAADPRTAKQLGVKTGAPLLRVRQLVYSKKGSAVVCVLGLYRPDRHNLMIRRYRNASE